MEMARIRIVMKRFLPLTFDQFKQDQVVQMRYVEENEERHYGFLFLIALLLPFLN